MYFKLWKSGRAEADFGADSSSSKNWLQRKTSKEKPKKSDNVFLKNSFFENVFVKSLICEQIKFEHI